MVCWRNICERLGACRDEQQQGDEVARWGQGCEGDDAADGVVNVREKEALACVVGRVIMAPVVVGYSLGPPRKYANTGMECGESELDTNLHVVDTMM